MLDCSGRGSDVATLFKWEVRKSQFIALFSIEALRIGTKWVVSMEGINYRLNVTYGIGKTLWMICLPLDIKKWYFSHKALKILCTSFDAILPKEQGVVYSCLILFSISVITIEQSSFQCLMGQKVEVLLEEESINLPSYKRAFIKVILRYNIIDLFTTLLLSTFFTYSLFLMCLSIFQIFAF